jgi:hypothetical protein
MTKDTSAINATLVPASRESGFVDIAMMSKYEAWRG